MQTELYRIFYETAKLGNITRAAEALYISQPAVSKSIKQLEANSGCTLFNRHSKGVSLTTEGKVLYTYVEKAFNSLIDGELMINKLKSMQEGRITIGISNILCKYFFMPYLDSFHTLYPNIKFQVINRTSPETLKLLSQGSIDFGIVSMPYDLTGFKFIELMTIQDIFVSNRKDFTSCKPLSVEDLSQYPLMMLEKNNATRRNIDDYFSKNHLPLEPEIEISSMDFLIDFAKIGIGIAAVVKEFVTKELQEELLYEIPLEISLPTRKIGIILPDHLPLSIATSKFIEHLKQCRS